LYCARQGYGIGCLVESRNQDVKFSLPPRPELLLGLALRGLTSVEVPPCR
jgi:hypothetical protein